MRTTLLFLFMIVVVPTYAHNSGNASGNVSDAKKEIPLVGVYVQIINSLIATTTVQKPGVLTTFGQSDNT